MRFGKTNDQHLFWSAPEYEEYTHKAAKAPHGTILDYIIQHKQTDYITAIKMLRTPDVVDETIRSSKKKLQSILSDA